MSPLTSSNRNAILSFSEGKRFEQADKLLACHTLFIKIFSFFGERTQSNFHRFMATGNDRTALQRLTGQSRL